MQNYGRNAILQLSSRRTVGRALVAQYEKVRMRIATSIFLDVNWCLELDYWTDKKQNSFLGMMYQFVYQGHLYAGPLAMRHCPKGDAGHTAERIVAAVRAELNELGDLIEV